LGQSGVVEPGRPRGSRSHLAVELRGGELLPGLEPAVELAVVLRGAVEPGRGGVLRPVGRPASEVRPRVRGGGTRGSHRVSAGQAGRTRIFLREGARARPDRAGTCVSAFASREGVAAGAMFASAGRAPRAEVWRSTPRASGEERGRSFPRCPILFRPCVCSESKGTLPVHKIQTTCTCKIDSTTFCFSVTLDGSLDAPHRAPEGTRRHDGLSPLAPPRPRGCSPRASVRSVRRTGAVPSPREAVARARALARVALGFDDTTSSSPFAPGGARAWRRPPE
jgi:hypothetical protein